MHSHAPPCAAPSRAERGTGVNGCQPCRQSQPARNRPAHFARISNGPTQAWMAVCAREALGFLAASAGERPILLRDLDTKFEGGLDTVLRENGLRINIVGPQAPDLNAIAERWVQTVEHECLDHFIVFGESHLRYLLDQVLEHFHLERPHQGLGNRPPSGADPPQALAPTSGEIECQKRLGGLLRHYQRRAA